GKSVVATGAGGIPLQVGHGKFVFLVEIGDTNAVANHLLYLYTNNDFYTRMSEYAKAKVSNEVETVGNNSCRLYLTAKLARGQAPKPNARWITDMTREEAS
ncbi:trehalose phosphorylase, partial [Tuber indicum]